MQDIATAVLQPYSITFQSKLTASYKSREYCVQYGETDLAFLHRLFAEEGIFYFFTHAQGSHTLVLADKPTAYVDAAQASVIYRQDNKNATDFDT